MNTTEITKLAYLSPTIKVVAFQIEQGFNVSLNGSHEGFFGEHGGTEGFFDEYGGHEGFFGERGGHEGFSDNTGSPGDGEWTIF